MLCAILSSSFFLYHELNKKEETLTEEVIEEEIIEEEAEQEPYNMFLDSEHLG